MVLGVTVRYRAADPRLRGLIIWGSNGCAVCPACGGPLARLCRGMPVEVLVLRSNDDAPSAHRAPVDADCGFELVDDDGVGGDVKIAPTVDVHDVGNVDKIRSPESHDLQPGRLDVR